MGLFDVLSCAVGGSAGVSGGVRLGRKRHGTRPRDDAAWNGCSCGSRGGRVGGVSWRRSV
jgi:hypothetical protein